MNKNFILYKFKNMYTIAIYTNMCEMDIGMFITYIHKT